MILRVFKSLREACVFRQLRLSFQFTDAVCAVLLRAGEDARSKKDQAAIRFTASRNAMMLASMQSVEVA